MAIDINEARVERNEPLLWVQWTLATALGLTLGYLPAALFISDLPLGIARVVVPLLAGFLIGIAQWLVLRQYVNGSHDWIWNHAGGWIVGYSLGLFVVQLLAKGIVTAILGFILFGIIIGIFQWPVLRREIPHILSWIIANVLGWGLGAFLAYWIAGSLFNRPNLLGSTLTIAAITGLVAGAITGLALIWIVRKPDVGTTISPAAGNLRGR